MAESDVSSVSRSKSWRGVMRSMSSRMGGSNGVGESKGNIFRAAWTLLREGGSKRNNLDATSEASTISDDESSNSAETDSPSSRSSGDSAGAASSAAAASPTATSLYKFFPPRSSEVAKAAVEDKEPERKTKAGLFGISRKSRSSSARHVMRGTSSARQRASGSVKRRLAPAGASSAGAGAGATQGLQTSVANNSVRRAASGKNMSPLDDVYHVAPRRSKVEVATPEKIFIQSLEAVNPEDLEVQPSSPLLGPERMRHPTSARNGEVFKKTLVLDLDETLISSRRTPCNCDYEIVFKVHYQEAAEASDTFAANADAPMAADDGDPGNSAKEMVREIRYYIRLRPGLTRFLDQMSALYELVVWTASGKSYADAIIDLLDPDGKYFSERLYRESCVRHRGLCVKDLRRLGRPMDSVVLLDNYVYSFGFTLDNGLPIYPWTGDEEANDSGLMMAYSLLKNIARVPDIRVSLITAFNLHTTIHGKRPPLAPISATPHLSSSSGFGSVFPSSPAAVNSSVVVVGS